MLNQMLYYTIRYLKPNSKQRVATIPLGAVHKVRHAIFDQFWPHASPCHTLSHLSGPPKVRHTSRTPLISSSTKNRTKTPVQSISQWFAGFLFGGFVHGFFLSGRFCSRWFLSIPLLSEYLHDNRKLTITFNFTFHMTKICKSVTSHALGPPFPVTNCHTFSAPCFPRAWRTLWTAPLVADVAKKFVSLRVNLLRINFSKLYTQLGWTFF